MRSFSGYMLVLPINVGLACSMARLYLIIIMFLALLRKDSAHALTSCSSILHYARVLTQRSPLRSITAMASASIPLQPVDSRYYCSSRTSHHTAGSNLTAWKHHELTRRQLLCREMSTSSNNERKNNGEDREDMGLVHTSTPPVMMFGNIILPFFGKLGAGIGVLGIGLLGLLYLRQGDLLYIPSIDVIGRDNSQNPRGYRSPAEYGVPFETHMIESTDGVAVHSWLLLHPDSKERKLPTIIFFHGNAGNIGVRVPNAVELFKLEANVLQVEYRGYGESTPVNIKPTERGIKSDAEAVLRFASNHPSIDSSRIFLFGRSLGGAVTFHVADYAEKNDIPLAGMFVENTFESIGHMVDVLLPFLSPFKNILLRNKWDSTSLAEHLRTPILYIAGDQDEIVPYTQMRDLYSKSSKGSLLHRFHRVEGGTHNETWLQGGRAYWNAIKTFLKDAIEANSESALKR